MLVKYKNLKNNKITEEKNIFINQLSETFPEVGRSFIRAAVSCFFHAIFKEVEIGIVRRGRDTDPEVDVDTRNFFSEIKRFSQAPNHYKPKTNIDLEDFDGESLKFLLRAAPKDLAEFAESYDTTIPDVGHERICEVTSFIFDAIREATERGLDGERCQTEKERIAEAAWSKEYSEKKPNHHQQFLVPQNQKLQKRKNLLPLNYKIFLIINGSSPNPCAQQKLLALFFYTLNLNKTKD